MAFHVVRSKIKQARKQFQRNEPVQEGLLRPEILESWQRSKSYGLDFNRVRLSRKP